MPELADALALRVMVGRVAPETLVVMDVGDPAPIDGLAVEEPEVVAEVLGLSALVRTADGRCAAFWTAGIFALGRFACGGVPGRLAFELLFVKIAMVFYPLPFNSEVRPAMFVTGVRVATSFFFGGGAFAATALGATDGVTGMGLARAAAT